MKVITFIAICLTVVCAEPPVPSNVYLPSSRTNTFHTNSYSSNTGVALKNSYLPPNNQRTISFQHTPSPQYGIPTQYNQPSSQYGAPLNYNTFNTPSVQYGTPSTYKTSYQHSSNEDIVPSQQYGVPTQYNQRSTQYDVPTTKYGVPTQYSQPSVQYGAPSDKYGVPSYARTNIDEHSEPANYNFQYDVQEEHYGSDFGHAEARQGGTAQGRYYVTLPDGRKQTVDYVADEHGYKPQISYQQTNNGYAAKYSGYSNAGGYNYDKYNNGY